LYAEILLPLPLPPPLGPMNNENNPGHQGYNINVNV